MSDPQLDATQQDMLARVSAGDLSADAPEVTTAMAKDARFRAVLGDLLQAQAMLDSAGHAERQLFLTAGIAPAPDVRPDLVAETIARLAQVPRGKATAMPRANRRVVWYALAAAALLVVGWALWGRGDSPRVNDDQRQLGGAKLVLLPPTGDLSTGLTLTWLAIPGARFKASIYDPQAPKSATVLDMPDTWPDSATTWKIDASKLLQVRPHHRWRVIALQPDGMEIERADRSLSR